MVPISAADRRHLIDTAHTLADAARAATLPYFRADFAVESKGSEGFDPVTAADRAAEDAMRQILAARRPDDGIFGEEFGAAEGRSGLSWILDPIDGTRGFLCGTTAWTVLIAVADEAGPRFGIIDQPYVGERFVGGFGEAEVAGPHGRQALGTRATASLGEALLSTTFPEIGTPAERAAFERVAGAVRLVRYGLDGYAYALLAAGQIDLVVEAGLQPYDVAAPIAVIEAAGGVVTDWQGGPASGGGQVLAAANAAIHAAALERLRG